MQFPSVLHLGTKSQMQQREASILNDIKAWERSLLIEKGLKFLLVPGSGLTLCRLWDALPRIAGVAGTERDENH